MAASSVSCVFQIGSCFPAFTSAPLSCISLASTLVPPFLLSFVKFIRKRLDFSWEVCYRYPQTGRKSTLRSLVCSHPPSIGAEGKPLTPLREERTSSSSITRPWRFWRSLSTTLQGFDPLLLGGVPCPRIVLVCLLVFLRFPSCMLPPLPRLLTGVASARAPCCQCCWVPSCCWGQMDSSAVGRFMRRHSRHRLRWRTPTCLTLAWLPIRWCLGRWGQRWVHTRARLPHLSPYSITRPLPCNRAR